MVSTDGNSVRCICRRSAFGRLSCISVLIAASVRSTLENMSSVCAVAIEKVARSTPLSTSTAYQFWFTGLPVQVNGIGYCDTIQVEIR